MQEAQSRCAFARGRHAYLQPDRYEGQITNLSVRRSNRSGRAIYLYLSQSTGSKEAKNDPRLNSGEIF